MRVLKTIKQGNTTEESVSQQRRTCLGSIPRLGSNPDKTGFLNNMKSSLRNSATDNSQFPSVNFQDPTQPIVWNKEIQVSVDVDQIADMMFNAMDPQAKHNVLITNAIIGTALEHGTIGYIYGALCGANPCINFQIGDKVICTKKERRENVFTEDTGVIAGDSFKPEYKTHNIEPIGECEVIEINLYAADKLRVRFMQDAYRSKDEEQHAVWVNHKTCSKLQEHPQVVR